MADPIVRRKFVLNDLSDNHNKVWTVELFPDGTMTTTWGRVGVKMQSESKNGTEHDVELLVRSKLKKGYCEIDLHVPDADPDPIVTSVKKSVAREVRHIIDYIFSEANDNIKSYLAVGVDALSLTQIAKARKVLDSLEQYRGKYGKRIGEVTDLVQEYYNLVPTKLPSKILKSQVALDFDAGEQESRLDQLEQAVKTMTAQRSDTGADNTDLLGADLNVVDPDSDEYRKVVDYINKSNKQNEPIKVKGIFKVINERVSREYDACTFGASKTMTLFHGTRNQYVRHILPQGLRVPHQQTNGWAFGPGIYFANQSSKSSHYCGTTHGNEHMMFVADVKVGKQLKSDGGNQKGQILSGAYDSVWGNWQSSYHQEEFVIFRECQHTMRYLVVWESGRRW